MFIEPISQIIIPLELFGFRFQRVLKSSKTHVLYTAIDELEQPRKVYFFETQRLIKAGILDAVLKRLDEMKSLSHPNIASVVMVHSDEDYTFMVVEDYPETDLEQYIVSSSKLPENEVIRITKALFEAFAYLHSKEICHGDLNPENISLNDRMEPKISNFTFSQQTLNVMQKRTTAEMNYIPPEILMETSFDPFAQDIWSLGVIVYIMATKKLPFPEKNQIKLINQMAKCQYKPPFCINPKIAKIISACLVADPTRRASAARIALELRNVKVEAYKNKLSKNILQANTYVSGLAFSRIEYIAKKGNIHYRRKTSYDLTDTFI